MVRYKILLYALVFTTPFINFSLIPGSNLPLPYITLIVIALILVANERTLPLRLFGYEDVFFLLFLVIALASSLYNKVNPESFTQIINYLLTYSFYKIGLILLFRSQAHSQEILKVMFLYNTCLQIFALVLFSVGFIYGCFLENTIGFFNNSENFSIGAISTVYPRARLFGFSPEPSFWSFFVAMNIAIFFTIDRPSKTLLIVNLISLIAAFGRTGFLMTGCVILLKFLKGNVLQKIFGVICVAIAFAFLSEYLVPERLMSVDASFEQRIGSMLTAIDLAKERFIAGVGLNNFKYYAIEQELNYLDIFNLFLNTLVSTGVFGLLCLVLCLFFIFNKIPAKYTLPFFAAMIGWMTVSSYNLPFVWFTFAVLVYAAYDVSRAGSSFEKAL
jgi:hypothetical protein